VYECACACAHAFVCALRVRGVHESACACVCAYMCQCTCALHQGNGCSLTLNPPTHTPALTRLNALSIRSECSTQSSAKCSECHQYYAAPRLFQHYQCCTWYVIYGCICHICVHTSACLPTGLILYMYIYIYIVDTQAYTRPCTHTNPFMDTNEPTYPHNGT